MSRFTRLKWLSPAVAAGLAIPAFAAPTIDELQRQLQQQQEQINALAAQLEKSPSKPTSKTHIGGYGEMRYNNLKDETARTAKKELDYHRFVLYFGHDFSESVRFVSELELEHSLAGDGTTPNGSKAKPGELELEQAYVEFDLPNKAKAKGGLFLIPVGILNETHEPTTFYGVMRNPVENSIIPTTWWEGGAAIGGPIGDSGLSYDLAIHSGLAVPTTGGSAFAVRNGRQKVANASVEDWAYTARLQYRAIPGVTASVSFQRQDDITQDASPTSADLIEAHVTAATGPFSVRTLWARWDLDSAAAKAVNRGRQDGYYIEGAYRVVPTFGFFSRHAAWDNGGTPTTGFSETEIRQINTGFNYWPIENVVIKADVQAQSGGDDEDGFNVGLGYRF